MGWSQPRMVTMMPMICTGFRAPFATMFTLQAHRACLGGTFASIHVLARDHAFAERLCAHTVSCQRPYSRCIGHGLCDAHVCKATPSAHVRASRSHALNTAAGRHDAHEVTSNLTHEMMTRTPVTSFAGRVSLKMRAQVLELAAPTR